MKHEYDYPRAILGEDFISPEEIENRWGVSFGYTPEQNQQLTKNIPSKDFIEECKDKGYALVAGPSFPKTLIEMLLAKENLFFTRGEAWRNDRQIFAHTEKVKPEWIMFKKVPVPGTFLKKWDEQIIMISDREAVPSAVTLVWCMATFVVVRNEELFSGHYVRTSSRSDDGEPIVVSSIPFQGIMIDVLPGESKGSILGLASMRK